MTYVWIVEWAFDEDPPTADSVWTTELQAVERANQLNDGDDYHLLVWVKKFVLNVPQGYQVDRY